MILTRLVLIVLAVLLARPGSVQAIEVLSEVDVWNPWDSSGMLNEDQVGSLRRPVLDWVIAGPETGPGKRPYDPAWIQELADQCAGAGVPFFDKRPDPIRRELPEAHA